MMKKLLLAVLIASFGLAACGVKGPLYFPEQQPAQQQTK
ncbi:putative membrane protein [Actinobacillus pleuropneumoniae]|nr:putative membrane protein [Actinobacillus pleuropneumoniae]KIE89195.1 putative membrane protein [Actinobacillus pleuropneumoniae]KIE89298.1 putative membrane protein [Actinobacillus pleuropneumoniae]KIE94531.1 putative membrane protein [Actinobacillus pleuropneumoniae]KIE95536.1 putative membrane protein [Actinobacillus pleuropneumoniae]